MIGREEDNETNGSFTQMFKDFGMALRDPNVIILMMQYACTFGVELQMDNIAANYFFTRFKLNQSMASIAASSFGLCNIFARAMGGILSDVIAKKYGMRGRLALQLFILLGTGCLVIAFALQNTINTSVTAMIFFSIFAEAGCGSTFGITPFVNPKNTGAVYGAVGAGGNIGAVLWGVLFLYPIGAYGSTPPPPAQVSLERMGYIILGVAVSVFFLKFPGHAALVWGEDVPEQQVQFVPAAAGRHHEIRVYRPFHSHLFVSIAYPPLSFTYSSSPIAN